MPPPAPDAAPDAPAAAPEAVARPAPMLLPIGQHVEGGTDPPSPEPYVVRIGERSYGLTDDEFAVWVLAHGVPSAVGPAWSRAEVAVVAEVAGVPEVMELLDGTFADDLPWSARTVAGALDGVGLGAVSRLLAHLMPRYAAARRWTRDSVRDAAGPATAQALPGLLERELLVEVDPAGPDAAPLAADVRLRTLLTLLPGPDDSVDGRLAWPIGPPGGAPAVILPPAGYALWRWAPEHDSLAGVAAHLLRAAREAGSDDPTETDGALALQRVWETVQILLASGAAYVDAAPPLDD